MSSSIGKPNLSTVRLQEELGRRAYRKFQGHSLSPFESCIQQYPDFDIRKEGRWGKHLLSVAADFGDIEAAQVILTRNASSLNLGNRYGQTPLFMACITTLPSPKDRYRMVEILLRAGARVNDATSLEEPASEQNCGQRVPANATPLWAAAYALQEVGFLTLLLAHGAVAPELSIPLHIAGKELLGKAQEQLADYKRDLSSTIASAADILPPLASIIAEYDRGYPLTDLETDLKPALRRF